ncbi:MAG: hypothetical protein Q7K34_03340, partial [archaeon]|nr:hypothetical protein [archaeon]
ASVVGETTPKIVLQIWMRIRGRLTKETTEAIEYIATNRIFGDATALKGLKQIDEFGELVDDTGKVLPSHTKALARGTKEFPVEQWTPIQRQGYHKYMWKSPQGQGDSIMVSMKKSGDFDDSMVKQSLDLDDQGNFKNIKFEEKIGGGDKDADNYIKLGQTEYWADSTSIESKLTSEQNLHSKLMEVERKDKFKDLPTRDGIQVIKLEEGTSLTKEQIESTLDGVLPQMNGTNRLKVYDTITGEVYWSPRR